MTPGSWLIHTQIYVVQNSPMTCKINSNHSVEVKDQDQDPDQDQDAAVLPCHIPDFRRCCLEFLPYRFETALVLFGPMK